MWRSGSAHRAAVIGAAAAFGLALALTGCGNAAENAAENVIEAENPGTDVELDGDGVKVTDEEGNTSEFGTGADLPDGWPTVVPVPDGDVTFASKSGEDFTAGVTLDGSSQDAYEAWKSDLEGAGFTEEDTANIGGNYLGTFTGNGYDVGYTISSDPSSDGKTAVILNVTPAS
jgi:hypothetical protein